MSGKQIKEKAATLRVAPGSRYELLQKLILQGFFDSPVSSGDIVLIVKERFGKSWKTPFIQTYMRKFMEASVIRAIKPNLGNNFWVLTSVSREEALRKIGKRTKVLKIEEELFSSHLERKMKRSFRNELDELRFNFGTNPNCTAFLLRKILEKLIIIVISKHSKKALVEDPSRPGRWIGLAEMIDVAAREKLLGIPFLVPRTAGELKGIKFLGDTSAHNPLASVSNETIIPQMPFIITAYEELAKRL